MFLLFFYYWHPIFFLDEFFYDSDYCNFLIDVIWMLDFIVDIFQLFKGTNENLSA